MSAKNNIVKLSFLPAIALCALCPGRVAAATLTINVSVTGDINFGGLDPGATGGGFRVRPGGTSGPLLGSTVSSLGITPVTPGQIQIIASTGVPIDLSVTNATYTLTGPGGSMTVNDFHIGGDSSGRSVVVTLASTSEVFPVGATLNVGAGQGAGVYSTVFSVNAAYQ